MGCETGWSSRAEDRGGRRITVGSARPRQRSKALRIVVNARVRLRSERVWL